MRQIAEAYSWVLRALANVAGVLLTLSLIGIIVDVTLRNLGFQPPAYTLPLVEYGLLYITMMMAPYLVRYKGHIVVEAFTSMMPKPFFRVLEKIIYFLCTVICVLFAWYAFGLLVDAYNTGDLDIRSIEIPRVWLFWPMMLGFIAMAIEFLRLLFGHDTLYTGKVGESGAA